MTRLLPLLFLCACAHPATHVAPSAAAVRQSVGQAQQAAAAAQQASASSSVHLGEARRNITILRANASRSEYKTQRALELVP